MITRALAVLLMACVMAVRTGAVELKNAPVTVTMKLAHARNPKRHLMLRIENISVRGEVGVWEVRAGDRVAGTLSTYGAEEQNGKFIAEVPMDFVRGRSVTVTFAPTAQASGTIRFERLRLVEE